MNSETKPIELTVLVRNNRLKQRRQALGLNQKQFAKMVGVPPSVYIPLEQLKKKKFSSKLKVREIQEHSLFEVKCKIAQALDSSVEEIFPDELDLVTCNRVVRHIDIPTAFALHGNGERLLLENKEKEAFDRSFFLGETIDSVLSILTKKEKLIIQLRFGLPGLPPSYLSGHPRTLKEVGRIFNCTRGRVMQMEAKAIRKLRQPSRHRLLREYL